MVFFNLIKSLSRTKTVDVTSTQTRFKRCLTTLDLTILGMGSMMGTGLYVLTGVVAKETAGPAVIISYIIAAIVSMMAAMCYAEFGSRVPLTGSAYTYTYVTIGELWAFLIGWNLVLEYVVGASAVARSWSGYFDELIGYRLSNFTHNVIYKGQPLEIPYLAEYPDLFSGLLILCVLILVVLGTNVSAKCINVMVTINLAVVAFVFVAGLFLGDIDNWRNGNFLPFGISGAVAGAASCFFAFSGFDVIALSSEEATDPIRGVPRATGLSVVFAGLCYVAVSISLTLMVPYREISENSAFAHAFATHGLVWAQYIVGLGALCGMFTSLLGCLFSIPRSVYAMANDGLLFTSLSRISERSQVPVLAAVIFGFISAVLAISFDLSSLVEFMSIGVLMAYAIVAGAVIVLRYRPTDIFNNVDTKEPSGNAAVLSGSDDDDEQLTHDECNEDQELTTLLEMEGSLKQRFKFLTFLASNQPGRVVSSCLFLTVVFQTAVVIVGVAALENIRMGEWWAITMVIVFGIMAIVAFIPIPMHNQTSNSRHTYRVPLVPYLPIVSIFCDIVLMVMLQPITWVRFGIWVGIGLLMYALYGYHHSVEGRQRMTYKPRGTYHIIAASNVTSVPLYGSTVLQQPKTSDRANETGFKDTHNTEL